MRNCICIPGTVVSTALFGIVVRPDAVAHLHAVGVGPAPTRLLIAVHLHLHLEYGCI